MFEQSLYNQEAFAPTPESHEGDLFYNYEFKNWNFSPRLYKILASAVMLDLLFLVVIAQADLTNKGCDTFLTSAVCQVIDTAYIANALFGTKREYVDAVYEKTQLKDADVTFVDVSDADPPFEYPGCYFPEATPEPCGLPPASNLSPGYIAPGLPIPNYSGENNLLTRKAHPPKANPGAVEGNIPSSPLGNSTDDESVASNPKNPGSKKFPGSKNGNGQPETSPNANQSANTNTAPGVNPTGPVKDEDINKRPFKDLGNLVNDLKAKNAINLETPFLVNAKGKLTKDGKLDPKTFKFVQATSSDPDHKMIEIVKEGIEAINDSGYLNYLKDLSGKDLDLLVQQNDQTLSAVIQSEMESETRAKSITSGLKFLIGLKKGQKESPTADQNDKDDLLLLNGATVVADGKKVVITFTVPKDVVQQMIQRKLDELAKEPKQSNDTLGSNSNVNTAANR